MKKLTIVGIVLTVIGTLGSIGSIRDLTKYSGVLVVFIILTLAGIIILLRKFIKAFIVKKFGKKTVEPTILKKQPPHVPLLTNQSVQIYKYPLELAIPVSENDVNDYVTIKNGKFYHNDDLIGDLDNTTLLDMLERYDYICYIVSTTYISLTFYNSLSDCRRRTLTLRKSKKYEDAIDCLEIGDVVQVLRSFDDEDVFVIKTESGEEIQTLSKKDSELFDHYSNARVLPGRVVELDPLTVEIYG